MSAIAWSEHVDRLCALHAVVSLWLVIIVCDASIVMHFCNIYFMLHASRCSYSKLSHEASYCFMHICLSPLLCVHKSRVLLNVQEAMDSHILEWEGLQRAAEEDESATRRLMTQQSDLKTKIASTRCAPAAFCHDRIESLF